LGLIGFDRFEGEVYDQFLGAGKNIMLDGRGG
jgi:hypothetical protein